MPVVLELQRGVHSHSVVLKLGRPSEVTDGSPVLEILLVAVLIELFV